MGLSGLVGAGAVRGLEDILTEQMIKAKFAEEQRQAQAQEELRRAAMAQGQAQFDAQMGQRDTFHADDVSAKKADDERADQERRDRSNRWGVEDMMRQAEAMQPKPVKLTRVTTVGSNGRPVSKGVTDDELAAGVPEYREPKAAGGSESKQQWLVRGGKKVYGAYQPGDEPYDAVAERKPQSDSGPSPYASERANRTIQAVDDLIGKVGMGTAGMGSLMANIPGTGARDFSAQLNTLKGNIAFNELAQMREASKTGGALGAISERELALLESTLGALDAGQSPDQLREQLKQVKASVSRWQEAAGAKSAGVGTTAEMPNDFSVKAPNGKVYPFKTAEEAAAFKRKAGIP